MSDFLNSLPPDVRGGLIGLAGAITGAVTTALATRYLQARGKTIIEVRDWEHDYFSSRGSFGGGRETAYLEDATSGEFRLVLRCFHASDLSAGLYEPRLVFVPSRWEKTPSLCLPMCHLRPGGGDQPVWESLIELDLPARQWVTERVKALLKPEVLREKRELIPQISAVYFEYRPTSGWRRKRVLVKRGGIMPCPRQVTSLGMPLYGFLLVDLYEIGPFTLEQREGDRVSVRSMAPETREKCESLSNEFAEWSSYLLDLVSWGVIDKLSEPNHYQVSDETCQAAKIHFADSFAERERKRNKVD